MGRLLAVALLLLPALAQAKSWMGIVPAETTRAEVITALGEPKKKVVQGDKEVLVWTGDSAAAGTSQVQVTLLKTGKVEQIVVFPTTKLEVPEIEESYGKSCAAGQGANCYAKLVAEPDFRVYFHYKKLGLIVFFAEDKKTVRTLVFTAPVSAEAAANAAPTVPPKPASPTATK